jgi:hypothetical protein
MFDTDHRPKDWWQKVLELEPNGDMLMTAILSMIPSEKTDDQQFYWFEEQPPLFGGSITGVFKNAALTTAYGAGNDLAAGSVVYLKVADETASQIRKGMEVVIRTTNILDDIVGKVMDVVRNGANSRINVRLLQADGTGASDLSAATTFAVIGDINAPGGQIPESVAFKAGKVDGYTQIGRTPLKLSRTLMQTKIRTGNEYTRRKAKIFKDHMRFWERNFWLGVPSETWNADVGENEYTTGGLFHRVKTGAPNNVSDFRTLTDDAFKGKTFAAAGYEWFLDQFCGGKLKGALEHKIGICGDGVLAGMARMAKAEGFHITPETKAMGINVRTLRTPVLELPLKTHPMFNEIPSLRNTLAIVEPKLVRRRVIQDTVYHEDPNNPFKGGNKGSSQSRIDGIAEEYLTEIGYQIAHAEAHMILNGVGIDNTLT